MINDNVTQRQHLVRALLQCRGLLEFEHTLSLEIPALMRWPSAAFGFFLYSEQSHTLCPVSPHLRDDTSPLLNISEMSCQGTLLEQVLQTGRSVLVGKISESPYREAQHLKDTPYRQATVMAAPLAVQNQSSSPGSTTMLGVLTLWDVEPDRPPSEQHRMWLESIGHDIAPVLERVLATEDCTALMAITSSVLVGAVTLDAVMTTARNIVRSVIHHEITILVQIVMEAKGPWFHIRHIDGITVDLEQIRRIPFEQMSPAELAASRKPIMFLGHDHMHAGRFPERDYFESIGIFSAMLCPIIVQGRPYGFIVFGSPRRNAFSFRDLSLTEQVGYTLSQAIANLHAYEEIRELKNQLEHENIGLRQEIGSLTGSGDIVGQSPAIQTLLREIEQIGPTDSTVLIHGETGTGKGLVARALHQRSHRSDKPFITINCAELTPTLIESELFGYEKGAFTGANRLKKGKFEVAQGGTVFLDEVGEIPLALQSKLLRVLEQQEFERVGGTQRISVDIRIIAATNIDVEKAVKAREFRPDLYFRLKVCPLLMPPLHKRRDDIPHLAQHFVRKYAMRYGKTITSIRRAALVSLTSSDWPGNVRELEHVMERAVILAQGQAITLNDLRPPTIQQADDAHPKTLEDVERHHILETLERCNWLLAGPHGAAAYLGVKRSTLQHRMKKLGISRKTP